MFKKNQKVWIAWLDESNTLDVIEATVNGIASDGAVFVKFVDYRGQHTFDIQPKHVFKTEVEACIATSEILRQKSEAYRSRATDLLLRIAQQSLEKTKRKLEKKYCN